MRHGGHDPRGGGFEGDGLALEVNRMDPVLSDQIVANCAAGIVQVWSLTQLYSVDFSQSRTGVNKCVYYKRTIKVCVSCC